MLQSIGLQSIKHDAEQQQQVGRNWLIKKFTLRKYFNIVYTQHMQNTISEHSSSKLLETKNEKQFLLVSQIFIK